MNFTYYYDDIKLNENEWLMFNISSGKIISVSDNMHQKIVSGNLNLLAENDIALLQQMDFIVPSHEFEVEKLKEKLLKMKYSSDSLVITILTNMDCNLGCKYCHEYGLMDHKFLGDHQIEKINTWIAKQLESGKYKYVTIYFYGGEPTLNLPAIEKIANQVKKFSRANNVKYDFTMSTNGTLLNDSTVARLMDAGVADIQITLDGPRDIHNFRKPFLDGSGSFDIILENIKKYCEKMNITIRVNVDKHNYNRVTELMDVIIENDLQKKVAFYLDLISSTHTQNSYCNNFVFTTLEEMSSICYLWKEQKERGIPLHGKNVIEGLCGNLSQSNVTISAASEFYICPGLCGIKDACLGDLDNGYNTVYNQMLQTNVWEKCVSCKYFPMCAGGCRAQAYMNSGSCFACYCKKEYYKKVVMKYIKYKYA